MLRQRKCARRQIWHRERHLGRGVSGTGWSGWDRDSRQNLYQSIWRATQTKDPFGYALDFPDPSSELALIHFQRSRPEMEPLLLRYLGRLTERREHRL